MTDRSRDSHSDCSAASPSSATVFPCKIAYEKGRGLLAYLAMESGNHARTTLAAMLWPNLARDAALSNLRLVLHNLRQALATPFPERPTLHIDRENVRLDPMPCLQIDVADFSAPDPTCLTPPGPEVCTPCLGHMEVVATLLSGRVHGRLLTAGLPGLRGSGCRCGAKRCTHMRALTLLARLADCHERMGAYAESIPFALRFLELAPWNEEGMRRSMRLFALNGQQAAALTQFDAGRRVLKRDLGVLPSEATRDLAERIRLGELSPTTRRRGDTFQVPDSPLPIAEKRQVTVLYCELIPTGVDDPDAALALLRAPQARCSEVIHDHFRLPGPGTGGQPAGLFRLSASQRKRGPPRRAGRPCGSAHDSSRP
jgi:DNA-binding SARP family transcriptional activator